MVIDLNAPPIMEARRPTNHKAWHGSTAADSHERHPPRPKSAASAGLKPEELRQLAAQGTERTFRKQTIITSEGDVSGYFYLVLSGRVKIFVSDDDGRDIVLATQGPGEYFGELVADDGPTCASVITLEPSRIAVIARDRLHRFLLEHPDVALKIVHKLLRRIRSLTQSVKALALMDVYGRVTHLFAEISASEGGSAAIERMTQQEIASRVGASREMISRVMKDLCARGEIELTKTHIRLLRRQRQ
jgi:CRP/FNR family cyclic AMP-dependent transcriptional regulator